VPALNSSNKTEQQLPSAEANPKLPKVKATRLSEKHQQPQQKVQLPSIVASPPMKRRKVNVSVTEEEVAMETEEERQLSLFSPRSSGRNKSNSSSLMSSPQNVNATVAVAASLNGHAKRKNEGMGGGGGGKNTGEAKSSQAQKAAGKEDSQQAGQFGDNKSKFKFRLNTLLRQAFRLRAGHVRGGARSHAPAVGWSVGGMVQAVSQYGVPPNGLSDWSGILRAI
jgi:hypothetical protein